MTIRLAQTKVCPEHYTIASYILSGGKINMLAETDATLNSETIVSVIQVFENFIFM